MYTVEPILQVLAQIGENITQEEGGSLSLNCTADGLPLPNIVWLLNGSLINTNLQQRLSLLTLKTNSTYRENVPHAITSVLTFSDLKLRDSGEYVCRADPPLVGRSDVSGVPVNLVVRMSM